MRNYSLIAVLFLSLIFGCKSQETADDEILSQDTKDYLDTLVARIDSFPINDPMVLASVGSQNLYYGKNERGNELIQYALSKMDSITGDELRSFSVQNTKNGNYREAIELLEEAMKLDSETVSRYYGWLLLYYYRDYEKALEILELHDSFTPDFNDAPMGEDIHYLKGLAHFQLKNYEKANTEFDTYITHLGNTHGEDFVDVYTFVQKGRSLVQLNRKEEAIAAYDKAILYAPSCTEAFYFKGLLLAEMGQIDSACIQLNTAKALMAKGSKSSDNYVEYFHEIYWQDIDEAIKKFCE
jgi:tetratricopeptide (TPR) repeat protein